LGGLVVSGLRASGGRDGPTARRPHRLAPGGFYALADTEYGFARQGTQGRVFSFRQAAWLHAGRNLEDFMNRLPLSLTILAVVALSGFTEVRGDDGPAAAAVAEAETATLEVIAAEEALEHVGEEGVVEFTVKAARTLDDKGICFLNSRKNHRESGNFTAVIFRGGLARFAAEGIEDPALEYIELLVRVQGLIEERAGQAQIVVESPTQIEVVEVEEPAASDEADR
jgi:DNA/RNA endonuclease YhcR with UshA esterase domain